MEKNFVEYLSQVDIALKAETIKEFVSQLKTFGKFQESNDGLWDPLPYSGYTLITPTFLNDTENVNTYWQLSDIREELFWNILFPGIVPAPTIGLHLTIGRLISGDIFAKKIMNSREEEFLLAMQQLFSETSSASPSPLKYEVKGLSVFSEGVIAAIVSPVTEDDYLRLQSFRNSLYTDEELMNLGVERKRCFNGHITLFYIEEKLAGKERSKLTNAVLNINKQFFSTPLPFKLTRAEVRRFSDFSDFYRQDHWPVYKF